MLLFFLRHADPIYSPDQLTPLGHRQAEALAKRLSAYGLDRIYSSTAKRAMQTAQPTCEMLKKDMTTLDWCHENHVWDELTVTDEATGHLTWCFYHQPTAKVLISPEVRALGREWYTHPAFASTRYGEGMKRVQRECDAFMLALGYRHDYDACAYIAERPNDERVALFAHHGFGVAFLSCLLDIPYPEMALRFDIGHSSMTVIDFTEKGGIVIPKVLQLSNDSHLWREGLPTKYQNRIYF